MLVEDLGPAGQRAARLTHGDVAARHPHLVHVALTDLGLTGPRAEWRLEPLPALAASGALFASGFPSLPPTNAPGHLAHDCAAIHGALGAVAAVLDRERTGLGQLVEVSAQEAALAGTTPWSVAIEDYLTVNPHLPAAGTRNADGSYWVLPAGDGWVRCVIGTPSPVGRVRARCSAPPTRSTGDEWNQPFFRVMNLDVIRLVAQERLADRTRAELFDQALGFGTTVGVLQHAVGVRRRTRRPGRGGSSSTPASRASRAPRSPTRPGALGHPDRPRAAGARADRRRPHAGFAARRRRPAGAHRRGRAARSTACGWSSSAWPPWCPSWAGCSPSWAPTS